jgi:hypothetical protein
MANTNIDSITEDFTAEEIVGMMTKTHRELEEEIFDELGIWNADGEKKQIRDDIRTLADLMLHNPSKTVGLHDTVEIIGYADNNGNQLTLNVVKNAASAGYGHVAFNRLFDFFEIANLAGHEGSVIFDHRDADRTYNDGGSFIDAALSLNEMRAKWSRLDKAMRRYNAGSAAFIGDIRTA